MKSVKTLPEYIMREKRIPTHKRTSPDHMIKRDKLSWLEKLLGRLPKITELTQNILIP